MKAIYASKMYKSSKNKDKIKSAIENPINTELVTQLKEYLDEEYTEPTPKNDDKIDVDDNIVHDDNDTKHNNTSHESGLTRVPHPQRMANDSSNTSHLDDDTDDDLNNGSNDDTTSLNDDNTDDDLNNGTEGNLDDSNIQNSSNVSNKQPISSQTVLNPKDDKSDEVDLAQLSERIKGTLNSRQDVSDVTRVNVKENELWIYYSDKVNLNNVMSTVIDLLQASNYYYLEFNRLARTDNAMVFEITFADTGDNSNNV